MKVRVHYTAQLRTAIGRADDEVELPEECSLAALLARLADENRDAARHLVTDGGDVQPSLLVAINNAAVPAHAAAATRLQGGDVVTIMPPIAGG